VPEWFHASVEHELCEISSYTYLFDLTHIMKANPHLVESTASLQEAMKSQYTLNTEATQLIID